MYKINVRRYIVTCHVLCLLPPTNTESNEEICDLFANKFFKICIILCLITMLIWKC